MFEEKELETLDTRDFDAEIDEILQLLEEKKYSRLRSILLENNAVDIAEMLENINGIQNCSSLGRILPLHISISYDFP